MNLENIYEKYKKTIILPGWWNEKLIHFSDLRNFFDDLIDNDFVILWYDGIFCIPGSYTLSPINLIRYFPVQTKDKIKWNKMAIDSIDWLYKMAKKDVIEDNVSMDDLYVSIIFEKI